MTRLTDGAGGVIAKAEAPERGVRFLFDSHREAPAGFGLRITAGGTKAFVLRYQAPGAVRLATIGKWPTWSLAAAREKARELRREIDAGGDPLRAKAEAKGTTFGALIGEYDTARLGRLRSGKATRRLLDRIGEEKGWKASDWPRRPVAEITSRDVRGLLDRIAAGTPVLANRMRAALGGFFGWCVGRELLDASPVARVKAPTSETSRDRVLSDDELRRLWLAADAVGYPFGPLVRLLILTGQRLNEVAGICRAEVEGDVWIIPAARAKNGREHLVPLPGPARAILDGLAPQGAAGLYFTTTAAQKDREPRPVSGWSNAVERLHREMLALAAKEREATGLPPISAQERDWTFHDLRRTAVTGMARLRVPFEVREAAVNHTAKGVSAVYNRHDFEDEKRAALDAWAGHVLRIVAPSSEKIVPLRAVR